jgi:leucyl/phenylalanyl-tRNA--protein transferase
MTQKLTPEMVLQGYTMGIFPMADSEDQDSIYWYEPSMRGIIPLDGLKVSKSLNQTLRSGKFHVTINESFEDVMQHCADRKEKWISEEIVKVYTELHHLGFGFSFETRNEKNELVGGLYGIALGKAFFGESMFHLERDASKVALVHLVKWMKENRFLLLDTQYLTDHLKSLGGIEIPQKEYLGLLLKALN